MISSPNETPFPLGRKQPNKSTREKGTQCKDATTGNKFTQAHKQSCILALKPNAQGLHEKQYVKLNVLGKRTCMSLPKESQLNKESNEIVGTGSKEVKNTTAIL